MIPQLKEMRGSNDGIERIREGARLQFSMQ
jgi:hypothetical protein